MTGPSPLDELLQKAEQARALLTEVRQALKDAKHELRDLREEHERWLEAEGRKLTKRIAEQVEEGLKQYAAAIDKQITKAQAAVDRRFDRISAILLGEERGDGRPSLEDMAIEMRRVRDYEREARRNRVKADQQSEGRR